MKIDMEHKDINRENSIQNYDNIYNIYSSLVENGWSLNTKYLSEKRVLSDTNNCIYKDLYNTAIFIKRYIVKDKNDTFYRVSFCVNEFLTIGYNSVPNFDLQIMEDICVFKKILFSWGRVIIAKEGEKFDAKNPIIISGFNTRELWKDLCHECKVTEQTLITNIENFLNRLELKITHENFEIIDIKNHLQIM